MIEIRLCEVRGQLTAIVGHRRAQEDRPLTVHRQLETPQVAGPTHVEAELTLGQLREVAVIVRDNEGVVRFHDQVGNVRVGRGRADVVWIAVCGLVV